MLTFLKFQWRRQQRYGIRKPAITRLPVLWIILSALMLSCEADSDVSDWVNENSLSISQYLVKNKAEYSKSHKLFTEGKMLNTLYGYNPNGNDYTLFLPTDEAIDQFIQQNQNYENFEELVKDTGFIKILTRYHTLTEQVHSNDFPDGALNTLTLTGDRLVTGFYTKDGDRVIKVNNTVTVIKSSLKMTNGYIHVISGVLQKKELSGYDWLQQEDGYSIFAEAARLSDIRSRLWWDKYTILAEHDSVYHRNGINSVQDLIGRIATPGMSISNKNNAFHLFAAYHFMIGEYYLNDLKFGSAKYTTLSGKILTINIGVDMKINPGIDTFGYKVSGTGDTLMIDYIQPVWESCNIMTATGAIHSISDLMFYQPFPKE